MALNKVQDGDGIFVGGVDSDLYPLYLQPSQYARGMNVVNRGGKVQCRPGYRCIAAWPEGRLQGFTFFKPRVGAAILVFMVNGLVYVSEYPYREFRQLENLEFSTTASQAYFCQTTKAVQINPDGSLRLIEPKEILVIQDGGFTAAATFDGTDAEHQKGSGKIPVGGPMAWVGDRLWVARSNQLFASDPADPVSFTEALYITTAASFLFKSEITALYPMVSSADTSALLVFTRNDTSMIQAGIRNRQQWIQVPNFQREILPNIGCVSQRSIVAQGGYLWWFSRYGLVSFDSAAQAFVSSTIPYLDQQLGDSKAYLSPDLSGVAGAVYENYLLLSVPYASKQNLHTWVLDNSPIPSTGRVAPAWNSFWTGTRPVQWFVGTIMGRERVFHISNDSDGVNRLWEAFTPDRLDDGCHISWWAEFRSHSGGSQGKHKEFRYADIFLSELKGTIDVAAFWGGTNRGKYKRILTKRILASKGMLRFGRRLTTNTRIFGLKKQSRYVRTQDARSASPEETLSSCDIESPYGEWKDDSFQLLVCGSGPGAVSGLLMYMSDQDKLDDSGTVEENETQESFVRFDGAATRAVSIDAAQAEFEPDNSSEPKLFFAARAESITAEGFTEVGVGQHTSAISQECAEKVASTIARRKAANALEAVLPKRVSQGGMS